MRAPSRWARTLAAGCGVIGLTLTLIAAASAEQPRCPLDVATCLGMYERVRDRPWMGVETAPDSSGNIVIRKVVPGSPAQSAGIRPGDILRSIEGQPPATWFAGKGGWINGESGDIAVLRGKKEKHLELPFRSIPEDVLARVIGVHMLEGHLAYLDAGRKDAHQH